jgi:hypothetical protein
MGELQIRSVCFGEEVMYLVPLPGIVPWFHSPAARRLFTVLSGSDWKEPRKATVSTEILTTRLSSSVECHIGCWVLITRLQYSEVPTGRVSRLGLFNGRTLNAFITRPIHLEAVLGEVSVGLVFLWVLYSCINVVCMTSPPPPTPYNLSKRQRRCGRHSGVQTGVYVFVLRLRG